MEVLVRAQALPQVTVTGELRNLHPLVQAMKGRLEDSKPNVHNLVQLPRSDRTRALCVAVSKATVARSLAFLDALIKAVERVGGKIEVVQIQWERATMASFCGEKVATIRLRERYQQVPRTTQPTDTWDWQKYDYIPNGRLVLDSGNCTRIHCQDTGNGRRIEDAIKDLLVHWVVEAGRLRIARREAKEERRHREMEDRQQCELETLLQQKRQELQEKHKAEQVQINKLFAHATAWQQSRMLRDYIIQMERVGLSRDGKIEDGGELASWLAWARQQADRLDPLTTTFPSVLDEEV